MRFLRGFLIATVVLAVAIAGLSAQQAQLPSEGETILFPSLDGLSVTGTLYLANPETSTPFIVLCHQAGWSRGEYLEIAPKLNAMGFNCLAIDQRSGNEVNDVANETALRAQAVGKGTGFPDAEQDMIAALQLVRSKYGEGTVLLWGSSYSAALALRITGEQPELVDGVLAFAPGEYFDRFGKPPTWIAQSATKIRVPAFITSAKQEVSRWEAIYEAIPGEQKTRFVPESEGHHGSRALWAQFADSSDYWQATSQFLKGFLAAP